MLDNSLNVAARIEQTSLPGRIQVTRELADRLDGRFLFEAREAVHLKGKGTSRPASCWVGAGRPRGRSGLRRVEVSRSPDIVGWPGGDALMTSAHESMRVRLPGWNVSNSIFGQYRAEVTAGSDVESAVLDVGKCRRSSESGWP